MQASTDAAADLPRLVTVDEIARDFGVSTATVYERIANDDFPIPSLRIGRLIRFRRADVEAFVAGNGGAAT